MFNFKAIIDWVQKPKPYITITPPNEFLHTYPEIWPQWKRNHKLPIAIICDLDGTLFHPGNRDPFDPSECDLDLPNIQLMVLLSLWKQAGKDIIYMTMRGCEFYELTQDYIDKYNLWTGNLIMRATNDHRSSAVIKKELYEQHVKGKYDAFLVYEDDNEVVDMWRNEVGIQVHQPNPGDLRKQEKE
jgi:hypothetical protein